MNRQPYQPQYRRVSRAAYPRQDLSQEQKPTPCSCETLLDAPSLAMVYSPKQEFEDLYCPSTALTRGTLFKALDKPFFGDGRCV